MRISRQQYNKVINGTIKQKDALQLLHDTRASLLKNDGRKTETGYLQLNIKGIGDTTLEAKGTFRKNKTQRKNASDFVKKLLEKAYGNVYTTQIEGNLISYLNKKGNKFGTLSFVKLMDRLDQAERIWSKKLYPERKGLLEKKGSLVVKIDLQTRKPLLEGPELTGNVATQINYLKGKLSEPCKTFFSSLLRPNIPNDTSHTPHDPPTFVLGDADGSLARMILKSIQSGHMELENAQLDKLSEIMEKELDASNYPEVFGLKKFQENVTTSDDLQNIIDNATYNDSPNRLIFVGDCIHDRFACNKNATKQFIINLSQRGAIFITGNHDRGDSTTTTTFSRESIKRQYGKFCNTEMTFTDIGNDNLAYFEQTYLKNAYYDDETNTFYSHHGIKGMNQENKYMTAWGEIEADSPQDLANKMNLKTSFAPNMACGFRPNDFEMYTENLGKIGHKEGDLDQESVLFVHGHNDRHCNSRNVLNLNARSSTRSFSPVGVKL